MGRKLTVAEKNQRNAKMFANAAAKQVAPTPSYDIDSKLRKLEDSLSALMEVVSPLAGAVANLQRTQGILPRAESPERILEDLEARPELPDQRPRHTVDNRAPTAHITGFQPNDVVRFKEDSPKKALIRANMPDDHDWDGYGVVLSFMGVNRNHESKYKVKFPGIGKDGVLAGELEAVAT